MLQAIIFDFDGVIADTEPLHFLAFENVLHQEQIQFDASDYFGRYLGLTDATFLKRLSDDRGWKWDEETRSRIQIAKDKVYRAHVNAGLPLMAGVNDLIRRSVGHRAMAVCSGARRDEIAAVLRQHGLETQLPTIVSADDVPTSKPDPTGYRVTLEALADRIDDLRPEQVLAIEDSLLGVQAAKAAGLRVLHVTAHPHHPSARNRTACERIADWACDGLEQITEPILHQWFYHYPDPSNR